jgi:hypothetical protein
MHFQMRGEPGVGHANQTFVKLALADSRLTAADKQNGATFPIKGEGDLLCAIRQTESQLFHIRMLGAL